MAKHPKKPGQSIENAQSPTGKVVTPHLQKKGTGQEMEIKFNLELVRISEKELKIITKLQNLRKSKILVFIA